VIAKKNIKAGDEITAAYQKSYACKLKKEVEALYEQQQQQQKQEQDEFLFFVRQVPRYLAHLSYKYVFLTHLYQQFIKTFARKTVLQNLQ
jgi:hypothetical protein